ncbi:MAG: DUF4383 domain-containing protein [Candidatus Woesearchaeota archaeon]|nr:DUF4383 domain-containing protein [Candidatus Woesearchaeota archaeon]
MKTISQKQFATWLGVILLVVGLWGLFNGSMLMWFQVNSTHSWVHIISGILGLLAGLTAAGAYAGTFNKVFGIVYLLVAILGFVGVTAIVDLLMLNTADNWLHLVIGVVTAWVGFKA